MDGMNHEGATVGQLLAQARINRGLSREALSVELKLPLRHLEAMEADDWEALPPGRPRPLVRQLAERLGVDLEYHTGAFQTVPGKLEPEPPDPRLERLERIVMGLLTGLSGAVVLWLVVPGPSLGHKPAPSYLTTLPKGTLPPPPPPSTAPYPVLGELLPEAPLNDRGILVSLRALDTCEVRIEAPSEGGVGVQVHTLRVSEPWRLRVKGPFSLTLDNAGVVNVEVAGHRVAHGQSVGEAWTGRFDAEGHWLQPTPPPQTDVPDVAPQPAEDEP
jgi:hypothetical protein